MPCCMGEKFEHWCKDVELLVSHQGKEYCIFHAPIEAQEKIEKWDNRQVFFYIDRCREATKKCNLSGAVFPENMEYLGRYNKDNSFPEIDFSEAIFNGFADFSKASFSSYADFSGTIFKGSAIFSGVEFNDTCFHDAVFNCQAIFASAIFKEWATLTGVEFNDKVCFIHSNFMEGANHSGSVFKEKADFSNAIYAGEVLLSGCTFNGNVDFSLTNFVGEANFSQSNFVGDMNFFHTKFTAVVDFRNCFFSGKTIFKSKFPQILFSNARFNGPTFFLTGTQFQGGTFEGSLIDGRMEFDRVDLRGLDFLGLPVERCRFIACKWPKSYGRTVIYDARKVNGQGFFELSNLGNEIALREHGGIPDPYPLEDVYRRLKKVAQDEKDDLLASDFHYAEKEMQREVLRTSEEGFGLGKFLEKIWSFPKKIKQAGPSLLGRRSSPSDFQWWNNFFLFWLLSAYRSVSGYGEMPLRAFLWLATLIVAPVLLSSQPLYYLPLSKVRLDPNFSVFWGVFATFWQALITIQAALLVFALRNKFKR